MPDPGGSAIRGPQLWPKRDPGPGERAGSLDIIINSIILGVCISFIHSFTKFRNFSVGSELTNDIRLFHAEMCPKSRRLNSSPMHWEWSVFRSWFLGHISDRWSPSSLVKLADHLTSWFHLQEHRSKDHVEAISKPSLQFVAIYKSPITMLQGEDCENL